MAASKRKFLEGVSGSSPDFLEEFSETLADFYLREEAAAKNPAVMQNETPFEVLLYRAWRQLGVPPYTGGLMSWPYAMVLKLWLVAQSEAQVEQGATISWESAGQDVLGFPA